MKQVKTTISPRCPVLEAGCNGYFRKIEEVDEPVIMRRVRRVSETWIRRNCRIQKPEEER